METSETLTNKIDTEQLQEIEFVTADDPCCILNELKTSFKDRDILILNGENLEIIGNDDQRMKMFADWANYMGEVVNPTTDRDSQFKNNANKYVKYVTLAQLLETTRTTLSRFGFGLIQTPYVKNMKKETVRNTTIPQLDQIGYAYGVEVFVKTILTHKDGALMSFPPLMLRPNKADAQGIGATITYCRRIGLSVLGVSGTDEDDNGEEASDKEKNQRKSPQKGNSELESKHEQINIKVNTLLTSKAKTKKEVQEMIAKVCQVNGINTFQYTKCTDIAMLDNVLNALN